MTKGLNSKENSHEELEYQVPAEIGKVVKDDVLGAGWGDLVLDRLTGRGRGRVRDITDKYAVQGRRIKTRDHAEGDAEYWRGGMNHGIRTIYNTGPLQLAEPWNVREALVPPTILTYGQPHDVRIADFVIAKGFPTKGR